jgi:para-nitrobenzyl esterase
MKKFLLAFSAVVFSALTYSNAQTDCGGNRYAQPIFTGVTKIADVKYGQNKAQNGTTDVNLFMDIYMPEGDTDTDRPVVLLAHGGSFVGGTKGDGNVVAQCNAFARMGYVAVSMQYRLLTVDGSVLMNTGLEFKKEVVRAIHDMRAAIRFLRKTHAEDGNPYGINPDMILAGGYSAGAILANHTTFLDSESKYPSELTAYVATQGGLEGNSGNPGYSSVPQMAISWCGAIMDLNWMEAGDQPYIGMHNLGDQTVPNLSGQPNIGLPVPVTLNGDSLMYKRALEVNIPAAYKSYPGNTHCDFPAGSSDFIYSFVHDQICVQGLSLANKPETVLFSVYPNPAQEAFFIDVPGNSWEWSVTITNTLGQVTSLLKMNTDENRISVNTSGMKPGVYMIQLHSNDGKTATKKVVVQ